MKFVCRFVSLFVLLFSLFGSSATAQILKPTVLDTTIAATAHLWSETETDGRIVETDGEPPRQPLSFGRGMAATAVSAGGAAVGGFVGYFLYWGCTSEDYKERNDDTGPSLGCFMAPLYGFYGSLGGLLLLPKDIREHVGTRSFIAGLIQLVPILYVANTTDAFVTEKGDFSWKAFQVLNIGPVIGFTFGWATSKRGVRLRLITPQLQRLPDIGQSQRVGIRTGLRLRW